MHTFAIFLHWVKLIGYPVVFLISIIGLRYLFYFHSFFFRWSRYRQLEKVTNDDIAALPYLPFIKIQITTRGSLGSTEVIRRGIGNAVALAREAPNLYSSRLSVEVITESSEQKNLLQRDFCGAQIPVDVFVLPVGYETPNGTKLKARALHYMVELRRKGLNRKPGKTFIVHYDEESVMEPDELRKLTRYLATTDKQLTEGPIYYPLEYREANLICRAMEANRPIGCFECREVMESGTPLHLHGSNLVIDEELENELGWDIGTLGGQAFIAEDYVFGVLAYLKKGPQIFGWHGCVMLEQPPFSFKSAFRQRYRWIVGILQGMKRMRQMPEFYRLPRKMRFHMNWGTRYRILTFALGLPTGAISLFYLLYQAWLVLKGKPSYLELPVPIMCWLIIVGFLWLNSIFVGSWYNISHIRNISLLSRWLETLRVLAVAPIAGILESTAGFWAVVQWTLGNRRVSWQPTPKTKQADIVLQMQGNRSNSNLKAAFQSLSWKFSIALLVTIVVLGAGLQGVALSGHSPLSQITSHLTSPTLGRSSHEGNSQPRDAQVSPVIRMHRPEFQTGVVFPQWGTNAYSGDDANWQIGLHDIQTQAGAGWIELPINFYQSTLSSTQVMATAMTPTPEAVAAGIRKAHMMNYRVFVVPLLTVYGPDGSPVTWSGSIRFASLQETEAWFNSYWQSYQPYVLAAAKAGADELAIGTELELLQEAPAVLWNSLIEQVHVAFPGKLTYDINWSSLNYPLPSWLQNPLLSAIGISEYFPLTDTPQRLDPNVMPALWKEKIETRLDAFAMQVQKPLVISEIGYRDSVYALYRPYARDTETATEPPDPLEQAGAYNAALSNVLVDSHIEGIFFWAWSLPLFEPNWKPAAKMLYKWYTSPQA